MPGDGHSAHLLDAGKTVTIDSTDTQQTVHCDDGIRTVH
jgi:hypothetical protein